jgi:hypothetical protein
MNPDKLNRTLILICLCIFAALCAAAFVWPQVRAPIVVDPVLELRKDMIQFDRRLSTVERRSSDEKARQMMAKDIENLKARVKTLEDSLKKTTSKG